MEDNGGPIVFIRDDEPLSESQEASSRKRNLEVNTIYVRFATIESNFKKDVEGQVVEGKAWSDPPRSVMS